MTLEKIYTCVSDEELKQEELLSHLEVLARIAEEAGLYGEEKQKADQAVAIIKSFLCWHK